jgi:hypothetical protein
VQDSEKNGMTKRKIEYWLIPPEQDAEFVACMEEVLEIYAKAFDPKHPVLWHNYWTRVTRIASA